MSKTIRSGHFDALEPRVPGVNFDHAHLHERDERRQRVHDQVFVAAGQAHLAAIDAAPDAVTVVLHLVQPFGSVGCRLEQRRELRRVSAGQSRHAKSTADIVDRR
ncbi:MAG TPA: hypothetical protein VK886_00920 [Vicinamibacterales bacterium]|nr:hypothetical protein [Vicinamibacterales bacterium]